MKPGEAGQVEYLKVTVRLETPKAIQVAVPLPKGDKVVWIAKSQLHENSEVYKMGTSGRLVIPLWLAEEKGLPT